MQPVALTLFLFQNFSESCLHVEEKLCSGNEESISASFTFESVSTPVTPVQDHPEPKPRRAKSADHAVNIEVIHEPPKVEEKKPSPVPE